MCIVSKLLQLMSSVFTVQLFRLWLTHCVDVHFREVLVWCPHQKVFLLHLSSCLVCSGQLHRADQWYVQVLVEGLPRCRDGSPFCSSFSFLSRPPQHRYHEQCHVTQWEWLVGRVEGWLVGFWTGCLFFCIFSFAC